MCSPGFYCPGTEGQNITTSTPSLYKCPEGHFCKKGSSKPSRCPSGYYQNLEAQSDCKEVNFPLFKLIFM